MTDFTVNTISRYSYLSEYLTRDALERLHSFIVSPQKYTVRVTETLQDRHSHIERFTVIDLMSGGIPHLVPVIRPFRGELIDTIEMGSDDFILGRDDTFWVIQTLMRLAAEKAGVDVHDPQVILYTQVGQLGPEVGTELFNTLRKMRRRRRPLANVPPELHVPYKLGNDALFFKLFRFFRTNQLILIPCSPKPKFFKLSYTTHVGQSHYRGTSIAERARQALGLAPYRMRIEIPLAVASQSYHLRFRSPVQHYIRRLELKTPYLSVTQRPHGAKDWELERYAPVGYSAKCTYRRQDKDGLAHAYTRNLAKATNRPRRLFVEVQLDERPLGQLFSAFLRLAVVLVSIILTTSMAGGLIGGQATLLSAVLVGLPAVLGISSLVSTELGRIYSPIAARVGSIYAAMASLVATFALVSWISDRSDCVSNKTCDRTMPKGVHVIFLIIELSILVAMLWCLATLILNLFSYIRGGRK